jgi:hypothetical protein
MTFSRDCRATHNARLSSEDHISFEPLSSKVQCSLRLQPFIAASFTHHARQGQAKFALLRPPEVLAWLYGVGAVQALLANAMCCSWMTGAFLRCVRRFGAPGLLLVASVAIAGSHPSVRDRSVSISPLKSSYALSRGATSFIIPLTDWARDRTLTFVNESPAADGQLWLAVSNQSLPAASRKWSKVEGAIRFRHARLFTVSLVGVEANYVRLTFQVEEMDGDASNDFPSIPQGAKSPMSASVRSRGVVEIDQSSKSHLRP